MCSAHPLLLLLAAALIPSFSFTSLQTREQVQDSVVVVAVGNWAHYYNKTNEADQVNDTQGSILFFSFPCDPLKKTKTEETLKKKKVSLEYHSKRRQEGGDVSGRPVCLLLFEKIFAKQRQEISWGWPELEGMRKRRRRRYHFHLGNQNIGEISLQRKKKKKKGMRFAMRMTKVDQLSRKYNNVF